MKESTTFNSQEQVNRFLALTVDVEQSYAPSLSVFEESIQNRLTVFLANQWKATCFVEGAIAKQIPGLLRLLADAGHEVGSHGFCHQDQRSLSPNELLRDLDLALDLFAEEGVQCAGYRAPFFLRHPDLEQILLSRSIPYDSSKPRIWFPGRYDNRRLPPQPFTPASGLLHVPVGAVRPWLPLSVEHHKALGFLFPKRATPDLQVMYVHSYSFGSGFKKPYFNRTYNLERTLRSMTALSGGASLGTVGELLKRIGISHSEQLSAAQIA